MSEPRADTANDFTRNLTDLVKRLAGKDGAARPRATGGTTTGGGNVDVVVPVSFRNPMDDVGELIRGGTAGAPVAVAAGTNGHVLTMVAGLPAWAAGGGGAGAFYRQYLYEVDGAGGWGFVAETIAGQDWPVLERLETE